MTKTGYYPELIQEITERLSLNQPVRRTLPGNGRLHIDRKLPFLAVYRRPVDYIDSGLDRLVVGEAAYLKVGADVGTAGKASELVWKIIRELVQEFGAFLVLEIWSIRDWENVTPDKHGLQKPVFRIISDLDRTPPKTLEILRQELRKIRISDRSSLVSVTDRKEFAPPGYKPILTSKTAERLSCYLIGLEVLPIYRDTKGTVLYPLVRKALHHKISRSLKQTFFQFMTEQTPKRPEHFHTLGRRAVVKAVWDIDSCLAKIINKFDFILLNTPVNVNQAWKLFKRYDYRMEPVFRYRPLPFSPPDLKRQLYEIPVHHVEDPTLAAIFEEQRRQLDFKISMLRDRGTRNFLYGSLQVYGELSKEVVQLAHEILGGFKRRKRQGTMSNFVDAFEFAETARNEINGYQQMYAKFSPLVKVRKDLPSLMVNRGNFLVPQNLKVPKHRVMALVQHEIGTHLLVHYNALVQPLHFIRCGLPGYEELQEGLAVFAEFMVGGLNRSRLRVLAARVVAASYVIRGCSFVETCAALQSKFDFDWHLAFLITTRIYRGGGLTKDVAYLRGLVRLIQYLKEGGLLDPLFIGKFAINHVPIIEELQWRQVLKTPPLKPMYLESDSAQRLLKRIRDELTVKDLIKMAS